jgi:aspartyl/asparaginyl beta-hydroxylase (cupin superfamily)
MAAVEAMATIIKSGLCKTNVRHRPAPSMFFFPGITSSEFWPKHLFPFTEQLEDAFPIIYKEYQELKRKKPSDYGTDEASKLHTGQWDWHSYVLNGKRQSDFAQYCPQTVELLESFRSPRLMTGTPFSYAFFSTLHPNSKIAAHTGPCNLRVRCHFPLEVPEGDCALRIADIETKWEVGKPIFFDDSYIHEGI